MSERYSHCKRCNGTGGIKDPILHRIEECPRCDGTGDSGDSTDYVEKQNRFENEREALDLGRTKS